MKKQSILHFLLTTALSLQFLMMPVAPAYAKKKNEVIKYNDSGADNHKGEKFIMSGMLMLTMPAIAVASIKVIQENGTCYSPWIFAGSAIYYGASEAMNWSKFKGGSDRALAIIRGEDKDLQIQSLQKAKEETARAKEAVATKVKNAKTAAVGFGVAAAVALAEAIANDMSASWATGCLPRDAKNNGNPLDLFEGAHKVHPTIYQYDKLEQLFQENSFVLNSITTPKFTGNESPVEIMTTIIEHKASANHSITLSEFHDLQHSPALSLLPDAQQVKTWFTHLSNLLIPTAHANTGSVYGVTGAGLALLTSLYYENWASGYGSWFTGYARSAWYGGSAFIAWQAASEFEDVLTDLKNREQKYDSLIHLLTNTNKVNSMELNGSIKYSNQSTAPILADPLKNGNNSSDDLCMAGGAGKAKPISCKRCNAVNKCKKSEIPQNTKFPADFPKDLAKATNLLKNMQDNRYKGNTSAATLAENRLGQYAAKIQKINKQLQDLANSNRAASGKKPINFKALSNKLMKKYQHDALAAVEKLPTNYRDAFHELGGAGLPKSKKTAQTTINHKGRSLSKGGGVATKAKLKEKKDALADLDFGLDEEANEDTSKNSALAENEEYDYGDKKNDIHEGKDTNIFKIITVRYLKSAYPRLLDEE